MTNQIPKEEMDFYKKLSKFLLIFILPAVIAAYYFYLYVPQQSCKASVSYHPAIESVMSDNAWAAKQGEDEHYSYTGSPKKFKTIEEAVSDCILKEQE